MKRLNYIATVLVFYCMFISLTKAQVVETEKGKVEFIGLKRWSIQMVKDSLAVYSPKGHGLWGCAAELVRDLHFANASVIRYYEDGGFYTVITVIEPQDSARIQYKPNPSGTSSPLKEFSSIDTIVSKNFMTFQLALNNYHSFLSGKTDSLYSEFRQQGVDSMSVDKLLKFISSKRDQKDKSFANWAALHDPNLINRIIAVAILVNFPEDDTSWYTRMEVLRDKDPMVSLTAQLTLSVLSREALKTVNWAPCVQTLHALLAGTNLFAYTKVLDVLQKTNISSSLSFQLLDFSTSDLLLANFQAYHSNERNLAHGFLKSLAGEDFGMDALVWQKWMAKIEEKK